MSIPNYNIDDDFPLMSNDSIIFCYLCEILFLVCFRVSAICKYVCAVVKQKELIIYNGRVILDKRRMIV